MSTPTASTPAATAADADLPVHIVTARPATPEAFAPFGKLLRAEGERRPIDIYGSSINVYRGGPIDADVPVEYLISRSSVREFRIRFLERHHKLAQSFLALQGSSFVVAVARPEARLEHDVPALDEIHAFIVPGDCVATIHRGTWHEPPYPLTDNQLRVTTSHAELTSGLEKGVDAKGDIEGLDVDKRELTPRIGVVVRIGLP